MADHTKYISMEDAAQKLGVKRATLYYYIKVLKLETKKFDLDKRKYLKVADFERINKLRDAATERSKKAGDAA